MQIWCNGSTPSFQVGCAGSNPVICSTIFVKAFHLHRIDDRRINHFTSSVAMGTVRPFQNPAHILHAGIAQLAEHRICNPGVAGSTPVISSMSMLPLSRGKGKRDWVVRSASTAT